MRIARPNSREDSMVVGEHRKYMWFKPRETISRRSMLWCWFWLETQIMSKPQAGMYGAFLAQGFRNRKECWNETDARVRLLF